MKRNFYIFAVLLVFIIAFTGCGAGLSPAAGSPIELRFATFIPPTDVYAVNLGNWAEELEQRTNGRVKVTFYHGQSLLKVPEILDGVAAGTADMAFSFSGVYPAAASH